MIKQRGLLVNEHVRLEVPDARLVWKGIVRVSGPAGLRLVQGFHDEPPEGEWQGLRSSRLDRRYRLIYEVLADEVRVHVIAISAHDHRMRQVDDKRGLSKSQEDGRGHGG